MAMMIASFGVGRAASQDVAGDKLATAGFVGQWTLNRALSDDPADQMRSMRGAMPSGRQSGRRSGGRSPEQMRSGMDAVRRAAESFSIRQDDSTVAIVYPDRSLTLFTDRRKQKEVVGDDVEIEYRAWWEGGKLLIERKLDEGLTLTEEYSVHAGTGRLHVLTRLEGDRLPRTIAFVRVYDPAKDTPEG
jgi:hypothetical protein